MGRRRSNKARRTCGTTRFAPWSAGHALRRPNPTKSGMPQEPKSPRTRTARRPRPSGHRRRRSTLASSAYDAGITPTCSCCARETRSDGEGAQAAREGRTKPIAKLAVDKQRSIGCEEGHGRERCKLELLRIAELLMPVHVARHAIIRQPKWHAKREALESTLTIQARVERGDAKDDAAHRLDERGSEEKEEVQQADSGCCSTSVRPEMPRSRLSSM